MAVVAATATLSVEDRAVVDARVGPLLGRLGVKQAGRAAARVAAELDAASVVARMEAAVKGRAGDGAAGSGRDGVPERVGSAQGRGGGVRGGAGPFAGGGVRVSVRTRGRRVVGWVRSRRTPRWRCCPGGRPGQVQPVEVHLVMTDRALLGTGDPDRSVFEPARIPGHGSVPAPIARAWLREGLDGLRSCGPGGLTGGRWRHGWRDVGCAGVGAAVVHDPGRAGPGRHGLPPAAVRWAAAPDAGAA